MARATATEIMESVKVKMPKAISILSEEDENVFTVYPPKNYYEDRGVDVFLVGNTAEMWVDAYREGKVRSIQNADLVADEIIKLIEDFEAYHKKENLG